LKRKSFFERSEKKIEAESPPRASGERQKEIGRLGNWKLEIGVPIAIGRRLDFGDLRQGPLSLDPKTPLFLVLVLVLVLVFVLVLVLVPYLWFRF
jgi:hypothetical protein